MAATVRMNIEELMTKPLESVNVYGTMDHLREQAQGDNAKDSEYRQERLR